MELKCAVQNYDWGKLGFSSEVAKLPSAADVSIKIEEEKPYAELWMGTHPNGPSHVIERDVSLAKYLENNLDSLGPEPRAIFGDILSFLFKVLSVRKALSIQAHPNKIHAEDLHAKHPNIYKDDNHKPELAIALTEFKALCGFRPLKEIQHYLQLIPEFQKVLGVDNSAKLLSLNEGDTYGDVLKEAFNTLMLQGKEFIAENLTNFIERSSKGDETEKRTLHIDILKRLHDDYPGDVGCWALYIFNLMILQPGEAIFLGPNLPHAYLEGDCIECMACSDNVVRAGLTPKFIDVETLVGMLDYTCHHPHELIFQPLKEDEFTSAWRPPVKDFAVAKITVPKGRSTPYNTVMRSSASILICISGNATVTDTEERPFKRGTVIFLKSSRQLSIVIAPESDSDLIIYQAFTNVV